MAKFLAIQRYVPWHREGASAQRAGLGMRFVETRDFAYTCRAWGGGRVRNKLLPYMPKASVGTPDAEKAVRLSGPRRPRMAKRRGLTYYQIEEDILAAGRPACVMGGATVAQSWHRTKVNGTQSAPGECRDKGD